MPGQHAGLVGQRLGVREVAVVAEREAGVGRPTRYTGCALRHVLEPVVE